MLETFFLGMAGAFAGDVILISSTYVAGFFATLFIIWEISINAHHPWLLGLGGAVVMLVNAWWARLDIRHGPKERSTIVLSSCYYCTLAIGLVFSAMCCELSESMLPPGLAFAALALTFLMYLVSIYELPPIAQVLLLVAQALVLFPFDTGEDLPWWTTAWVAVITLLMSTWWARQRVTRTGPWVLMLNFVYALALAGLTYQTVRPGLDPQEWMGTASVLSIAFLVWGGFTRVWPIALAGQIFLAIAVYHFFVPPGGMGEFPWAKLAAATPLAVVFSTARATHEWLRLFPEMAEQLRSWLRATAYCYQGLALVMLLWLVHGTVSPHHQVDAFLLLGTLLFLWNLRPLNGLGIRASFVLTAAGLWVYLVNLGTNGVAMATFLNTLGFLGLLAQPAFLRRIPDTLISQVERWALILVSVAAGWLYVSVWIQARLGPGYLTLGWAMYAFFIFLLGLFTKERRQSWCGPAILVIVFVRVFCHDFWSLSTGYMILTVLGLTVVTFILGYLILHNANQSKKEVPPST